MLRRWHAAYGMAGCAVARRLVPHTSIGHVNYEEEGGGALPGEAAKRHTWTSDLRDEWKSISAVFQKHTPLGVGPRE